MQLTDREILCQFDDGLMSREQARAALLGIRNNPELTDKALDSLAHMKAADQQDTDRIMEAYDQMARGCPARKALKNLTMRDKLLMLNALKAREANEGLISAP